MTDCLRRNSLQPEIFEGLQILKSAYRNGHISAVTQAAHHTEGLIRSLNGVNDLDTEEEL